MKVSAFSIIRNALVYGYPVVEAITSVLPLCDEFIVNVGRSDDETLELVRGIDSPKIRIIEREWDMTLRTGGQLLSIQTNHALEACTGDWCFYIQADEVLHEKYISVVQSAMSQYLANKRIDGLQFGYKHFYGSYDYYQDNFRTWYVKETRVIRRRPEIVSWGDGMDFRYRDGSPIRSKRIKGEIYHYGWVRSPETMIRKNTALSALYYTDEEIQRQLAMIQKPYDDLGHLKRFTEPHPRVMEARIAASILNFDPKIDQQHPDWLRHLLLFLQPLTKRVKSLIRKLDTVQ